MNPQMDMTERRNAMPRRRLLPIIIVVVYLWMPSAITAQDTFPELKHGLCIPDCIRKWCYDDYCPKPIPCPIDVKCFGCDCYQPKRLPCPIDVNCFRCDDYGCKPFPHLCCPPSHYLKCARRCGVHG